MATVSKRAPRRLQLDVVARRGDLVESRHRVHAAVVDAKGRLVAAAHSSTIVTCWRSCAKPFQALPFVRSGAFERTGWGDDELALACASHGGEPEHVALAGAMLHSMGLDEGDLACGPHEPLTARGARVLRQQGARPTRLHNNCSGKHSAMLAFARDRGWPTLGYERDGHPVQQAGLECVAEWSGVPARRIATCVDGCGVVAFGLPLVAMARAFARLGTATEDDAARRVLSAFRSHPFLVGGTDRFDTLLMEETNGAVVAKVGAEGVHSVTVPDRGLGLALKAEDGASRAQQAAVLRLLQLLDVLPASLPARLAPLLRAPITNTRGEVVGVVEPVE